MNPIVRGVVMAALMAFFVGVSAADDYATLLKRLQSGDFSIDFKALRLGYAATSEYASANSSAATLRQRVQSALQEKRFDDALADANAWLALQYVNPFAHLGAAGAIEAKGDAEQARFHRRVAERLYESICGAGEGASIDQPCQVISPDEELFYLVRHGFELGGRVEATCAKALPCTIYEVREPGSELLQDIHFDVSIPYALQQKLETESTAQP